MDDLLASAQDLTNIRGALLDFVGPGGFLAKATLISERPPETEAALWLTDPLNSVEAMRGRSSVRAAHTDIAIAISTGFDYAAGYAALAKSTNPSPPALAAVTRGCIEVMARAHWLLGASSARDLVTRHSALVVRDLKFSVRFGHDMSRPDKASLSAVQHREIIEAFVVSQELDAIKVPSVTELAASLIDGTFGKGAEYYSQLSAIAHGESFAINMFLQIDVASASSVDPSNISSAAPKKLVLGYAEAMLEVGRKVVAELVRHMEPPINIVERWDAAAERAWLRLAAVDEISPEDARRYWLEIQR